MSKLAQVVESVEKYNKYVLDQVKRARTDQKFGRDLLGRWNDTKAKIPVSRTPTGLPLPRLALPEIDEPGEIARYIFGEGLPGEFPYLNATYREMYLEPVRETESFEKNGNKSGKKITQPEEPTRLFSGLMTEPKSLAPYLSAIWPMFGPCVTHELWMLSMLSRKIRASACIRKYSETPVGCFTFNTVCCG